MGSAEEKIIKKIDENIQSDNGDNTTILSKNNYEILRKIIDSLPYYVILVDEDHNIYMANKKLTKTVGLENHVIKGKYCPKAVHGIDGPYFGCPLEDAVKINASVEKELYDSKTKQWMKSCVYPLDVKTETGKELWFHTTRVITEEKKAQLALKENVDILEKTMKGVVCTLAKVIEARDPYTAGHQQKVAYLACAIAQVMGLPNETIKAVHMAALIHDIGKVMVPSEILSKPGQLNDAEMNLIKMHPKVGYKILQTVTFPWPIDKIVIQHHERIDGSGYPMGLKDNDISLEAKILAVADVVEAMHSHRPYRPALGTEKALGHITENKGVLYDKKVVEACLKAFNKNDFQFKREMAAEEFCSW